MLWKKTDDHRNDCAAAVMGAAHWACADLWESGFPSKSAAALQLEGFYRSS